MKFFICPRLRGIRLVGARGFRAGKQYGVRANLRFYYRVSLLNPNKQTLHAVAQARARERKLIRDFQLLNQSALRGETTEDRIAHTVGEEQPRMLQDEENAHAPQASVHLLMRLDHRRVRSTSGGCEVDVAEALEVEADLLIFNTPVKCGVREFDFDE